METPHSVQNTKEFEVTGVSRSGRVRKKSSKLLDFQSPDDVEKKVYKRTTSSAAARYSAKYTGRGRPSLAALKARRQATAVGATADNDDMAQDDDDADLDNESDGEAKLESSMDMDRASNNTDEEDEDNLDDMLVGNANLTANSDSDDDGFGELVADLVGTEDGDINSQGAGKHESKVRKSLYMSEKRLGKDGGRVERKDKGKSRYTAYSLWAREYRKSSKFGKEIDFSTARRELWANVSNKEKNTWRRKAKIQATKAKALEKAGINRDNKKGVQPANAANNQNSTFINRPTTSRTKKLAEDKQKAKDEMPVEKPSGSSTPKRTRNNSYNRRSASASGSTVKSKVNAASLYATTNGSSYSIGSNSTAININMPLPTIEPIDAAAHLKLLGESLTIIGDRLKEHEGQIAVSGSLSVLLDSLLCSLGPLLCLTINLPGLDKKPKLKANLATTLDNIAYVMPGL